MNGRQATGGSATDRLAQCSSHSGGYAAEGFGRRESMGPRIHDCHLAQGTDTEQRYLAAMASLGGEGPFPTLADSQAYRAKSTTDTSLQRDGLISKGLIWSPRRGQVAFTVPRFAEFIREFYPLDQLD